MTVFAQRTCSIILFYLVIAALMVWVGGKVHTVRKFLMAMGIFLGGNFLMGGFLSVLPYKARKNAFSFLAITITAYWMLYIGIRLCKYLKGKELPICEVVVTFQGKEMTIKGLYDTGNCLRDQETGKSVAVMDYSGFCRPVSYTHLDVYKRQRQWSAFGSTYRGDGGTPSSLRENRWTIQV